LNAEKLDEFTENALTQLLESSHVIRCFLVDALGIDLAAEAVISSCFRRPEASDESSARRLQVKLKAIDIRAIPKA
jgi:hypothetical protein